MDQRTMRPKLAASGPPRRSSWLAVLHALALAACSVDRSADSGASTSSTSSGAVPPDTSGATEPATTGDPTTTNAASTTTDPGMPMTTEGPGSTTSADPGTSTGDATTDSTIGRETTDPGCHSRYSYTHECKPFPADCPPQPPWPPVECGDVVCAEGELCVVEEFAHCCASDQPQPAPGSTTDGEPDTNTGPDPGVQECLGFALCSASLFPEYMEGQLSCPDNHGCI